MLGIKKMQLKYFIENWRENGFWFALYEIAGYISMPIFVLDWIEGKIQ